ncbi:dual specificity protein phosphatase 23 isoform X3 [Octopus sinensis]|uniref:Dual specificity protein phosphatase 23 n=1 Tax=Octopus sinensis TaxID=2607531 RepID=A0A6P7SZG8_9MOLL|nr:dual specificity protein phosphatase 23 isoform X3 [Octopus sinensis]
MSYDGNQRRCRIQGAWSTGPAQEQTETQRLWAGPAASRPYYVIQNVSHIPERSGSNKVSKSTSNPDIFPSSMNNNNNNNNDSNQHTKANPAQIIPKIPKNFSWVVDGFLAALGFPNEAANMMYLVKHGIKYLISLTAELTPSLQGFEDKLVWSQIKIKDFSPPTLQQVDEFLKVVEKARSENSAVAIHCAHGKGRTGTMIACYLIKYHNQTASEALRNIRESRPGSVETFQQEELIYMFENQHNQTKMQKGN